MSSPHKTLLSPRSQDASQLDQHDSPLVVAPQNIQHSDHASQHSFACFGSTWPGPHSKDFPPAQNLEHSQCYMQMLACNSSNQRLNYLEDAANQYALGDLATEYLGLGHPIFAIQPQELCSCDTRHDTDCLGIEHINIPKGTEPNDPVIELPKNECPLPDDGGLEKDSPYWEGAKDAPARLANFHVGTNVSADSVSVQYNASLVERNDAGIVVEPWGVSKPDQRSRVGYLHREETDAINNGTDKCNITEVVAPTTTEYIGRRQTTYTDVDNLSTDKKGQEPMSRIRGNLVNLEHQTMGHAKRQLDAIKDSFH